MNNLQSFETLGQIAWLWMNSNLHNRWSTHLMTRNVISPISLGQYKVIYDSNGFPVAYSSWAFFSKDAEARYIANPSQIRLEDWNSGDRMWFIDYISPFSVHHTLRLKKYLRLQFPTKFARALRVTPQKNTGKVLTYFGKNVPDDWRETADKQILSHFTDKDISC